MRVSGLEGNDFRKDAARLASAASRTADVGKAAQSKPPTEGVPPQGDSVAISGQARQIQRAREVALAAPDVREEKVAELKAMIKAGTYAVDSRKVAEKLLAEELHLPPD